MNLIIFYFISKTVDLRSDSLQGASTYFAFALAGIVLTMVMQTATIGLARRIREEQLTGTLEVLVTQPITSVEMALGLTGFPFLFSVLRVSFYLLFAAFFLNLDVSHTSYLGLALILVASGAALAGIGIILGGVVLVLKQGEILASLVTFGFGLLSGALFPRTLLPEWLQRVGDLLPTRFALEGMRSALFEGDHWEGDLIALVVTAAVLVPASVVLFSLALRAVRRAGSLTQY
jgi:ABC-2 type transport system permease protein